MEEPITIRSRFLAFIVDIFIVYFIRSTYLWITWGLVMQKRTEVFFKFLMDNMGLQENFSNIDTSHVQFFLSSNFFICFLFFIAGAFIISILYNFLCFVFLKFGSVGQRIMKIHVVRQDGSVPCYINLLERAFLIVVPWILVSFVVFQSWLNRYGIVIMPTWFLSFILLLFVSWYDIIFFSKKKFLLHDFFSKTILVYDDPNREEGVIERYMPNPRNAITKTKEGIKSQIEWFKNLKNTALKAREERKKNKK